MTSFDDEGARIIDKFNGKNFDIWKFKLKMGLVFVDFWNIVYDFENPIHLDVVPQTKVRIPKACQKCNVYHYT